MTKKCYSCIACYEIAKGYDYIYHCSLIGKQPTKSCGEYKNREEAIQKILNNKSDYAEEIVSYLDDMLLRQIINRIVCKEFISENGGTMK